MVNDEQVELRREGDCLLVSVPAAMPEKLKGYIEARGLGLVQVPHVDTPVPLAWIVDMADRSEIERLPAAQSVEYLGLATPLLKLDPFSLSATALAGVARAALRSSITIASDGASAFDAAGAAAVVVFMSGALTS